MQINIPVKVTSVETFGQITIIGGQSDLTVSDYDFEPGKHNRVEYGRFQHPSGPVTYDVCVFDFHPGVFCVGGAILSIESAGWQVADYTHLVHWLKGNNKDAFGEKAVVALGSASSGFGGSTFYPSTKMSGNKKRRIYPIEFLSGIQNERILAVRPVI
ncbi:MAG: hypothetical protein WC763_03005 [Candidatus Paceibacterota bacterium]|jgi:hypothetical protein